MEFLTIRDFRNSPGEVWEKLEVEGKIIITNNGKPVALMLPIDGSTLEETLNDISRIQAKRAIRNMQRQSVINGTDKITMAEIDAEIAAYRRERRTRLAREA